MTIRAILFDFGGVLLRTEDHSPRRRWEERLGLPEMGLSRLVFGSPISIRAQRGEVPEEAVWQAVAATLGLGAEDLARLRADFWAGDRLDRELVAWMRGLRPRYKVGLLSNAWNTARRVFSQIYGLDEVADVMVISAEEGVMKPDGRIYRIALERLGVSPEEAILIDDMPENVEGARALGLQAIRFEDTAQTVAELRRWLDEAADRRGRGAGGHRQR